MNLTTIEGVTALMESSQTAQEWDANCDKVKAANGGYPGFWYATIVISGLAKRIAARWAGDAEIHISAIDDAGNVKQIA
jgi:hypothetical protein